MHAHWNSTSLHALTQNLVSLPEIPWERQTLISNTSIKDSQVQSWKLEIDDGRLFFYWANPDGVFLDANYIGDKSLRSGVLIQKNGKISNTSPPIVDPSFLSQLTTAHNGYLTFSVEFGIFMSILFYLVFFIFILKQFILANSNSAFTFLAMMMFFVLNFQNAHNHHTQLYKDSKLGNYLLVYLKLKNNFHDVCLLIKLLNLV